MKEAPTTAPSTASARERKCQETSELTGKETSPGKSCEARSFTGTTRLKTSPSANPGSVILSGKSCVSASVKINPNSRNPSAQYFRVASLTKVRIASQEDRARQEFYHQITRRNLNFAIAAAATQDEPA